MGSDGVLVTLLAKLSFGEKLHPLCTMQISPKQNKTRFASNHLEHFQKRIAEIYRERCPQVKINSVILPMYIWYVVIFIVSTVVFFYILMAFTV